MRDWEKMSASCHNNACWNTAVSPFAISGNDAVC